MADDVLERACRVVERLTTQEKASLCSGRDFWHTESVDRAGVRSVTLTDGPHGVRLQAGPADAPGIGSAVPATCFPTGSALAATWDPELLAEVGEALARECLALGVGVLLGPGVNLKRDPRCGRNFEYLSEDPLLAGTLAAALIEAVQSQGVGTSLKHLAGNDQETRRLTIDAVYDERTLRELELTAFELAVRRAQPWTVMCAYNRLNGTYAAVHRWLLTDVLRGEWGFEGIVVTDWGAMTDRVAGLLAGCDLEMPGTDGSSDAALVTAVAAGRLPVEVLDEAATRLVALALRAEDARRPDAEVDHDAHHALARRVASQAVVLCRNVDVALPIGAGTSVALIGDLAVHPRYQGTGSSRIVPTRLDDLRTELGRALGEERLAYAAGYGDPDRVDDAMVAEAVAVAGRADVVVVCVGLPQGYENEGDDRLDLRLPRAHDALVSALAAVHDRVVVVLANGAPVELPWIHDVEAVLEGYLPGQAGAGAIADVLTGAVNPSGRLAETFPRRLADVPTERLYPGGPRTAQHREGLYVGYRFYDTVGADVLFPFGHGLSYTTFQHGEPVLSRTQIRPEELAAGAVVGVAVDVTNTGDRPGREVVQVYVRDVESAVYRPDRELRAFAKVHVEPGETRRVEPSLGERAFAFWDVEDAGWTVEPGRFEILVGASSRDLRGQEALDVVGEPLAPRDEPAVYRRPPRHLDVDAASFAALLGRPLPPEAPWSRPHTRDTPFEAVGDSPVGKLLLAEVRRRARSAFGDEGSDDAALAASVDQMPLRSLLMFGVTGDQLDALLDVLNGRWSAAGRKALQLLRNQPDPLSGSGG